MWWHTDSSNSGVIFVLKSRVYENRWPIRATSSVVRVKKSFALCRSAIKIFISKSTRRCKRKEKILNIRRAPTKGGIEFLKNLILNKNFIILYVLKLSQNRPKV